jgi:AMMECR1 domain-containing protein/orotate phosphoribosyltransferase
MLDSLCVSLTPEGINMAGRCLLKLLESFSGRTIATMGTIGIPLLSSCVLQSGGRYEGLLVRKELKKHGSRKWFEGRINKDEPVIILDDSVSSGTTMIECRRKLEEAGFRVEGGVCLVRFGWYGGFGRMREMGYHMEALYDIYEDFMNNMDNEPNVNTNPTLFFPDMAWHEQAVPDGLHPADVARRVMAEYLRSGKALKPPQALDKDYDGRGGVWVSIRSKAQVYLRHAREGMWYFPGEEYGPLGKDLVKAAVKTAAKLKKGEAGLEQLETSALAVTFFSPLEQCTVGELDNDRCGIVVRSKERPYKQGGALPRMPGISTNWKQFQHARMKNAGLVSFEPFNLYRHDVLKVVEPGETWQPTGVPKPKERQWDEDPATAGAVTERAFDLVRAGLTDGAETTGPLPAGFLKDKADSIFISIYLDGKLRGCMGGKIDDLDNDIKKFTHLALEDSRFEPEDGEAKPERITVTVSFLWRPLFLGQFSAQEVMNRVRFGQQAVMVSQNQRSGILLPFVATTFNLNPVAYALEVIDKAGITRPPYNWRRYDCRTWMAATGRAPQKLAGMFPETAPPKDPAQYLPYYAKLLSDYLVTRQREEDGSLYFRYLPFKDALVEHVDLPRMAHGCWIMTKAGYRLKDKKLQQASARLLDYLLKHTVSEEKENKNDKLTEIWISGDPKTPSSVSDLSFLLLAVCALPKAGAHLQLARGLAATLWSRIDNHGKIHIFRDPEVKDEQFQDYSPGQLLLALAAACERGYCEIDRAKLDRAFDFYRHRFRYKRDFGQVGWMMQAFTSWWFITKNPEHAAFVFEIGDWVLQYQDQKEGGFQNDHQPNTPGYTTALYLEGLGAAARLADAMDQKQPAGSLRQACYKGFQFLDRIIIQERDIPVLPNPEWALGGVRPGIHGSDIRTDFVQHTLSAVLECLPG